MFVVNTKIIFVGREKIMKQYYLGLDCYDNAYFTELVSKKDIKGLVVGDLFCNNRMFEHGIIDLLLLIDTIASHKKTIIFQCPIYVTSRNIDQISFMLKYIERKNTKTYVIVHDLGMVNLIHREFKNFEIIWGRMARFRDYVLNHDFLMLLKDIGISGFELQNLKYRYLVQNSGLMPFIVYGEMKYVTIGRQCYNKYQGLECCREDCLNGRYSMNDLESDFKMTINGYIMGERFIYNEENKLSAIDDAEQVVYAANKKEYNKLQN